MPNHCRRVTWKEIDQMMPTIYVCSSSLCLSILWLVKRVKFKLMTVWKTDKRPFVNKEHRLPLANSNLQSDAKHIPRTLILSRKWLNLSVFPWAIAFQKGISLTAFSVQILSFQINWLFTSSCLVLVRSWPGRVFPAAPVQITMLLFSLTK